MNESKTYIWGIALKISNAVLLFFFNSNSLTRTMSYSIIAKKQVKPLAINALAAAATFTTSTTTTITIFYYYTNDNNIILKYHH